MSIAPASALIGPFCPIRAEGSEESRYCRIHGLRSQPDDPARDRPRTGFGDIQDLQRLLVFWPADDRRASPGFACCAEEVPARLGHHQARTESCLGTRGT